MIFLYQIAYNIMLLHSRHNHTIIFSFFSKRICNIVFFLMSTVSFSLQKTSAQFFLITYLNKCIHLKKKTLNWNSNNLFIFKEQRRNFIVITVNSVLSS